MVFFEYGKKWIFVKKNALLCIKLTWSQMSNKMKEKKYNTKNNERLSNKSN